MYTTLTQHDRFRSLLVLVGCCVAVLMVGYFGAQFRPGAWYAALAKPPWTPPNWVFGPVWTILYVFIAIAGWRILTRLPVVPAGALWIVQLVLNGLWPWLFFGLQRPELALIVIALLFFVIVTLIVHLAPRDLPSFWLLLPYSLWIAYAISLNGPIVMMNP
jgi:translocator protein